MVLGSAVFLVHELTSRGLPLPCSPTELTAATAVLTGDTGDIQRMLTKLCVALDVEEADEK